MKDFLRKLLLCAALFPSGICAHLWWGHEYRGPGMNQVDVLIVVVVVSAVLTLLFAAITGVLGWLLRRQGENIRLLWDIAVFLLFFAVAVAVGLDAKAT